MSNENSSETLVDTEENEIQKIKESFGIEILINEFSIVELEEKGYRKIVEDEICYLEPLLKLAPQLIVDKVKRNVVKTAFEEATKNSYKCILDPSKHLATIKGTTDVYIGSALDNSTNKLAGQARWLKNDVVLSISNAPQIALSVFNALSVVTGQYFMAQVNASLSDIKDGIVDIKQYFDDIKQSELETALQELNEILEHLPFIKNDPERVRITIIQIDNIRKISKEGINLYKNQIERIKREASISNKEAEIKSNTEKLQKNLVQYRYAIDVYNLAQILKVYLNKITDTEELHIYRKELSNIVNQYKYTFSKTTEWAKKYIDQTNILNKASKTQILISLGSGIVSGVIGGKYKNYQIDKQTASLVNDLFNESRKKKKEEYVLKHKEYHTKMSDMTLVDSSILAMDRYIEMANKRAEIISVDGEYYIKYID